MGPMEIPDPFDGKVLVPPTEDHWQLLSQLKELEEVHLVRAGITDDGVKNFANLRHLSTTRNSASGFELMLPSRFTDTVF